MPVDYRIDLTADEALVLLAWLARFNREECGSFVDQAEQRVLWDLESQLEAKLSAPLSAKYEALLEAARGRLRDPED